MKVFINANNAKTGGGITILNGLINSIQSLNNISFVVLVPNEFDVEVNKNDNIDIIKFPSILNSTFMSPLVYGYYLGELAKKLNVDGIINLGDLVVKTNIRQVYVFDWPYAVYNDKTAWAALSTKSKLIQSFKKYLIARSLKKSTNLKIVAQTSAISKRLEMYYDVGLVDVLPIPVNDKVENIEFKSKLIDGKKLLYLSHYYPHKNFEILIKLAEIIKQRNSEYKIVTTISDTQGDGAKRFLDSVNKKELGSIIQNLGPVPHIQCKELMKSVDALLMPTLLETYGIPYVEAMFANLPIFTSDRDFSRAVCQDSAFYFDPLDAKDIFEKLDYAFGDLECIEVKKKGYYDILHQLPNWQGYCDRLLSYL